MNAKARAGLLATVLAVVAFGGGVLAGCTTSEGYTVIEAQGGYADDAGNLVENGTLVYTGIHAGEQEVLGLVDDLKAALHVESVYVTSAQQGYAIYGGTIASAA